jgi:hypothetical protein
VLSTPTSAYISVALKRLIVGMSQGLLAVLAEFFDVIGSQKAHWYRVFDAKNGDAKDLLIQSTFPSLASLMKMER